MFDGGEANQAAGLEKRVAVSLIGLVDCSAGHHKLSEFSQSLFQGATGFVLVTQNPAKLCRRR